MNKRPPKINSHCHLLCLEFIPNKMSSELALSEQLMGCFIVNKLVGAFKKRGSEFLAAFTEKIECTGEDISKCFINSTNPAYNCEKCFGEVIKNFIYKYGEYLTAASANAKTEYLNQNNKKFDIYIPLMMDLEWGANSSDERFKGMLSYKDQIQYISEQVKRFPLRVFPFVMFDPRRENSFELCKEAIEQQGFLGIKMYPPMGYFPNAANFKFLNSNSTFWSNKKREELRKMALGKNEIQNDNLLIHMDEQLVMLYEYCQANSVPITTHAGASGAYDLDLSQGQANIFSNIDNWQEVLHNYPDLRLNFAHLGGNYIENPDLSVREQAAIWRKKIINILKSYQHSYGDISYHDMGLESRSFGDSEYHRDQVEIEKYFFELKEILTSENLLDKILFGTDTPMITHSWSEADYFDQFSRWLSDNDFKKMATINPIRFLFEEDGKIPQKHIDFLNKYNPDSIKDENLPEWVIKEENDYYIAQ